MSDQNIGDILIYIYHVHNQEEMQSDLRTAIAQSNIAYIVLPLYRLASHFEQSNSRSPAKLTQAHTKSKYWLVHQECGSDSKKAGTLLEKEERNSSSMP